MKGHLAFALLLLAACKNNEGSSNEQLAREDVSFLVDTSAHDVGEVERGLVEGAKRLSTDNLASQSAKEVATVRRQVLDLNSAKTVVFGVVNLEGKWTVTDAEKDPYAGNGVGQGLDTLYAGAKTQPFVSNAYKRERKGTMESAFIAASAIRDTKGNINGYFVTTVSLAEYAYRLQEALKSNWAERARKENGILPLFYVVVATPGELLPAPKVPSANVDALRNAGIFEKAKTRSSGILTISERKFGYSAALMPKLGNDVAVAVLHSQP